MFMALADNLDKLNFQVVQSCCDNKDDSFLFIYVLCSSVQLSRLVVIHPLQRVPSICWHFVCRPASFSLFQFIS